MRQLFLPAALLASSMSTADVLPEDSTGPFAGGFGLPGMGEGGLLTAAGRFHSGFSIITASHAIVETEGDESLVIDGETIRALIDVRYGIRPGLELGVELPYVMHQAGNLDSLIDTWHDIFNLPEGSRDDRPQDILDFTYSNAIGDVVAFTERTQGLGDVRLFAGLDLASSDNHKRSLRLSVKFPTGDAEELLGSGGTDVSVGVSGDIIAARDSGDFSLFYRANVTYLGEPDLLADIYNDLVWQFSAGVAYPLHPRFALNAQSTLRTSLYDSDIETLGEPALTLTFGGTIRLTERLSLGLGVTEDIKVNSAPDVTFNLGFRYRP
ncbi:MAG: DUF3187 family protein [Woeseiaceae bacterium]|nr:DUF3187 family protein [Woeseiaceae bacterium]